MTLPPSIMRIHIGETEKGFRLWLPIFLLWPIVLLAAVLLAPFVLVGAILLWPKGWGRPLLLAGPLLLGLVFALRGLKIDVVDGSQRVYISFV
jgi:hypothetical protein